MQGSGFRVQDSGFRIEGSGFRVQGSGSRVQGAGFRIQGSGCRVDLEAREVGDCRGETLDAQASDTRVIQNQRPQPRASAAGVGRD